MGGALEQDDELCAPLFAYRTPSRWADSLLPDREPGMFVRIAQREGRWLIVGLSGDD